MDPHARQALGQRGHLNVFGEDELLEPLSRGRGRLGRDVEQDHAAGLEHVHVGQHAALRRQPCRVTAGARGQGRNVVGQQSLQIRGAIGTSHGNLMPGRDCPYGSLFPDVAVVVHA